MERDRLSKKETRSFIKVDLWGRKASETGALEENRQSLHRQSMRTALNVDGRRCGLGCHCGM